MNQCRYYIINSSSFKLYAFYCFFTPFKRLLKSVNKYKKISIEITHRVNTMQSKDL